MYEPNDSPFGDAYRAWKRDDAILPLSIDELDELASCARYELSIPANADDADLRRFSAALEAEITKKCVAEDPAPVERGYF